MQSGFSASCVFALGLLSAGIAVAQTTNLPTRATGSTATESALEEIVVTAQRRAENLQDVPITVTAVSGTQLIASGVTNTQDLAAVVPGLTFPQATANALPHLRGVGSTAVSPGAENSVALYVDGVYYATGAGGILTLNNASQVEVLKGPQGTLFGRNATGGLIQVNTKDPTQDVHGSLEVGYGNYETSTLNGYLTGGIANNLAADLAVQMTNQGEGFGRNLATGDYVYQINRDVNLRSKLLWTPTDDTRVHVIFDYRTFLGSMSSIGQLAGASNVFYPPSVVDTKPYDVDTDLQPVLRAQSGGASVRLDQNVGFATFVSTTAYREQHLYYTVDFDLGPANIITDRAPQQDKQITQELQLLSKAEGPLQWTLGLFYFHADDGFFPLFVGFGGPAEIPVGPGLSLTGISTNAVQKTDSVAGYGQATYEIAPNTHLTAGLRYTYEKKDFSGTQTGQINNAFPAPLDAITGTESIKKPTWRLSLDHRLNDDLLVYASYNRGFKSGGYNTNDPTNAPYKPEQLDAYEIGAKSEFLDHTVRVNGSVFYYKYDEIQISRFNNGTPDIYNGASAELYGLDLDIQAELTTSFTVSGGLEALHDRFTEFNCADYFVGGPNFNAADCGQTAAPALPYDRSAKGNQLPDAASLTADLGFDYKQPLFGGVAHFNVTDAYNGGFFYEPDNNLHQKAYNLVNTSILWNNSNDRYSLRLWARNLADERYTYQLASASTGFAETFAPPRTFGISAGVKF